MSARAALLLIVVAAGAAPAARADVKLHPIFADHMVLQRGRPVPVFGTAAAGEKVVVGVDGPALAAAEATADAAGNWAATLPALAAGVGFTVTVKGANTVTLTDVLVGDLWLCSGQSNMEWRLRDLPKDDQGKRVAAAAANPMIRLYDVPNRPAAEPQATVAPAGASGKWLECTPGTAINFSAVGYFFGRDIQKSQNVPVGLIASDWGGTPCEAWTSRGGLAADPVLKPYLDRADAQAKAATDPVAAAKYTADLAKWKAAAEAAKTAGKPAPRQPAKPGVGPNTPTALFNGMIAPLTKFPVAGAIWYQGESNAAEAKRYRTLFPAMITDWRKQWGYDFPFFAVALAPFRADGESKVSYAELRDAQFHAAAVLPKVATVVITDCGDRTDIHPQRKEPVGARLALAARNIHYGEAVVASGPVFKSLSIDGDKAVVTFASVGGGLTATGDAVHGFAVAGEDGVYYPATATITGDTVAVKSDKVPAPKHVRFGWVNFADPELNLFNKEGLPARPFRTDELPLTTR